MSTNTLITNVNVFDGKNEKLIEKANVLVEGNKIKQVSARKIKGGGVTVIDGGGRTLTPGFIAGHEHLVGQMPFLDIMFNDSKYAGYVAS